jgi:hypothetical protein
MRSQVLNLLLQQRVVNCFYCYIIKLMIYKAQLGLNLLLGLNGLCLAYAKA